MSMRPHEDLFFPTRGPDPYYLQVISQQEVAQPPNFPTSPKPVGQWLKTVSPETHHWLNQFARIACEILQTTWRSPNVPQALSVVELAVSSKDDEGRAKHGNVINVATRRMIPCRNYNSLVVSKCSCAGYKQAYDWFHGQLILNQTGMNDQTHLKWVEKHNS